MARDPRRCAACGLPVHAPGEACPNPDSPFAAALAGLQPPRTRLQHVAAAVRWTRDRRSVLRRLDDEDLRDARDECARLLDEFAAECERRAV